MESAVLSRRKPSFGCCASQEPVPQHLELHSGSASTVGVPKHRWLSPRNMVIPSRLIPQCLKWLLFRAKSQRSSRARRSRN